MKRTAFAPYLFFAAALSIGLSGCDPSGGKPRIGVAFSSVDDGFVSTARRGLEAKAEGRARISILDGQDKQEIQDAQIDAMIADKAKVIVVAPVDPSAMGGIAQKAMKADVPVVFFVRNPAAAPAVSWEKAYFVRARGEEAEQFQVEVLADYWKAHPEADKNGDGKVQYLLLRGESNHQAALASAERRDKAFAQNALPAEKVAEVIANWTRTEAMQKVGDVIRVLGPKRIEAVLCANDEMALGAISALKVAGFFKGGDSYLPVVGIDGTRFALDAIADGSLLGTVRNDAEKQGKEAFDLAYALARGDYLLFGDWSLAAGNNVLVSYVKVTQANYRDFAQ
jgi:methyl-galactoside transport system substrate-binding protein